VRSYSAQSRAFCLCLFPGPAHAVRYYSSTPRSLGLAAQPRARRALLQPAAHAVRPLFVSGPAHAMRYYNCPACVLRPMSFYIPAPRTRCAATLWPAQYSTLLLRLSSPARARRALLQPWSPALLPYLMPGPAHAVRYYSACCVAATLGCTSACCCNPTLVSR